MEYTIHKQSIELEGLNVNQITELQVPLGSVFLSAQNQRATGPFGMFSTSFSVWYRFPSGNIDNLVLINLLAVETGKQFELTSGQHIGTVLFAEGGYVLHVFIAERV